MVMMMIITVGLKSFMLTIISMKFSKIHLNLAGRGLSAVSMATVDLAKTPHLCVCLWVRVCVWIKHQWFQYLYYSIIPPSLHPHLPCLIFLPGRRWLPRLQGRYGYQGRQGKVSLFIFYTAICVSQILRAGSISQVISAGLTPLISALKGVCG